MRYPVILLDVGGTLVGPRVSFGAVYADACAAVGLEVDATRVERSIREVWDEMDRLVPAGTDRYAWFPGGEDGYWLRFARGALERATGRPLDDDVARRLLARIREAFMDRSAWSVFPDVRPALEQLRADGARLAVVSNWDSRLPRVLELLELAPLFETVVVSHLEGVEKPAPEIFRRALARLGAPSAHALHVGDVPELDLAGARAAGVDALLVDRRGSSDAATGRLADLSRLPRIARGEDEPG